MLNSMVEWEGACRRWEGAGRALTTMACLLLSLLYLGFECAKDVASTYAPVRGCACAALGRERCRGDRYGGAERLVQDCDSLVVCGSGSRSTLAAAFAKNQHDVNNGVLLLELQFLPPKTLGFAYSRQSESHTTQVKQRLGQYTGMSAVRVRHIQWSRPTRARRDLKMLQPHQRPTSPRARHPCLGSQPVAFSLVAGLGWCCNLKL